MNASPISSCFLPRAILFRLSALSLAVACVTWVTICPAREIGKLPTPPSEAGYATESVIASGQRGGSLLPNGTNFTHGFNREMGEAMEMWNAHRWEEAVERFKTIYTEHPDSPWAAEAELHIACYLRFNCQYEEAEDRFISVLTKYYENEGIRKRVLHYLPHVYALRGRIDVAMDLLNMLGECSLTWQERQHVENWRRTYHGYLIRDEEDRRCGVMAAALALAATEGGDPDCGLANVSLREVYQRHPWSLKRADHPDGYSLYDLVDRAGGRARHITFAELRALARPGRPVLAYLSVPPEPRVYREVGRTRPTAKISSTGHFVVVERVKNRIVQVLDPRGGRGNWTAGHFKARWSGDVLLLGPEEVGTPLSMIEAQALRGGCCGNPPPDPDGGLPCSDQAAGSGFNGPVLPVNGPGGGGPQGCSSCRNKGRGSPAYDFDLPSANLVVMDTPMWYPPALGPAMRIELTHNRVNSQNMATNGAANYYSFGNKWSCNFNSYLVERPATNGSSGADLQVTGPGGQNWVFYSAGTTGEYVVADSRNEREMGVHYGGGGTGTYSVVFARTATEMVFSTNSTTAVGQQLERLVDRYGNELTYQYDASGRLTNVVDEIGRFFAFEYDSNGYVTNITDALDRNCSFTYSTNGNLTSITDMGGYTSTIGYDTNNWVTSIEYPDNSTLAFDYQSSPGLDPENVYLYQPGYAGIPLRIQVTDDLSETNEYFYHGFSEEVGPITVRDRAGNEWVYGRDNDSSDGSPMREVIYTEGVNSERVYEGPGWLDIYGHRWAHRSYDVSGNPIRSVEATNENTMILAFDGDVTSLYDVTTNHFARYFYYDTNNWVTQETWHTGGVFYASWSNRYDNDGNLSWHRDALSNEVGATYNDTKDVLTFTNRLDQVTRMGYNSNGRITALTNARDKVTSWIWNDSGWNTAVTFADGSVITGSYDSIGRLDWIKGPSGFEGSLEYDDLDRVTEVTFHTGPNGGETYPNSADTSYYLEYGCCGLDKIEDRLGNETLLVRDALGRVIKVIDAEDHPVLLSYGPMDKVTNLAVVVEGQTNSTVFGYTSTNGYTRLTSRASPLGKTTTYDYTFRGWPKSRTDGEGRTTPTSRICSGGSHGCPTAAAPTSICPTT